MRSYEQSIELLFSVSMEWFDTRIKVDDENVTSDQLDGKESIVNLLSTNDKIWYPDLYMMNSREIHFPRLTWEPQYFRFYRFGKVSTTILVRANIECPMNFLNYPVSFSMQRLIIELIDNQFHISFSSLFLLPTF